MDLVKEIKNSERIMRINVMILHQFSTSSENVEKRRQLEQKEKLNPSFSENLLFQ